MHYFFCVEIVKSPANLIPYIFAIVSCSTQKHHPPKNLDLFSWWFFYGLYHGIHQHQTTTTTTVWDNFFGTFSKHLTCKCKKNDGHFRIPKRLPAKPKHNGAPKVRAAGAICLSYAAMVKGLQTRWDFFGDWFGWGEEPIVLNWFFWGEYVYIYIFIYICM